MVILLLLLPWMALGAFALLRIRLPVRLPAVAGAARPTEPGREGERAPASSGAPAGADHPAEASLVSIVVPARNEEATIEALMATRADTMFSPSVMEVSVDSDLSSQNFLACTQMVGNTSFEGYLRYIASRGKGGAC